MLGWWERYKEQNIEFMKKLRGAQKHEEDERKANYSIQTLCLQFGRKTSTRE